MSIFRTVRCFYYRYCRNLSFTSENRAFYFISSLARSMKLVVHKKCLDIHREALYLSDLKLMQYLDCLLLASC